MIATIAPDKDEQQVTLVQRALMSVVNDIQLFVEHGDFQPPNHGDTFDHEGICPGTILQHCFYPVGWCLGPFDFWRKANYQKIFSFVI